MAFEVQSSGPSTIAEGLGEIEGAARARFGPSGQEGSAVPLRDHGVVLATAIKWLLDL